MFVKCLPEFFRKQRFLSFRFYYETNRNHCEGHDRAILAMAIAVPARASRSPV